MTHDANEVSPITMDIRHYHKIDSEAALEQASEHSMQEPVVLFKHSTRCGISRRARRQIEALTEATDPPVYEVVVQEARPLSNKIAESLGIKHQSPQVILLHQRAPVFDASHGRVTASAVREAVENATAS